MQCNAFDARLMMTPLLTVPSLVVFLPGLGGVVFPCPQLRALSGCTVRFEFTRMETHSIPDGTETSKDAEGNTVTKQRFANVQVRMHYTQGTLRVGANTKKDWAAGFKVSVSFSDGHGRARAPHTGQMHDVHGSTTLGHSGLGILDSFDMTPDLQRLLMHPQNRPQWESRMPGLLQKGVEYRKVGRFVCVCVCVCVDRWCVVWLLCVRWAPLVDLPLYFVAACGCVLRVALRWVVWVEWGCIGLGDRRTSRSAVPKRSS